MEKQIEIVINEFTKQAETFNEYQNTSIKEEATKALIQEAQFTGTEDVLEVAAGTCSMGRKIAPFAKHVIELDATNAMLTKGKEESEKAEITNVSYVLGVAERLPFLDESFNVVASRLAFHHFQNISMVLDEVERVLKPNGKFILLDMVAENNDTRDSANNYEKMRDPSHTNTVTEDEFLHEMEKRQMKVLYKEKVFIPMELDKWLGLTNLSAEIRDRIYADINIELAGGNKTGLEPYIENGRLMFAHNWFMLIAQKKSGF